METKYIKVGVFGCGRGATLYESILGNNAEIVALCDINEKRVREHAEKLGKGVGAYTSFDEFIEHKGMDAVVLCNFFHEHAPYAIKALEKGIHVLSECNSNVTMAEGVALVRAAEKSSAIYMISENYPYYVFNQEMRRVYREGTLGKVIFAEGEYNHPFDPNDTRINDHYVPNSKHWRYNLPRSYYITHSLGPLMYITGSTPVRVNAFPAYADPDGKDTPYGVTEKAAIISCINDDGSVFRVTGFSEFGGHENSYRICGNKGQIENLRDGTERVSIMYNSWDVPEGRQQTLCYTPVLKEKNGALAKRTGHGGADFRIIREFLGCVRENRRPEMDEYFATTMASVAILAHKSMLEGGKPYDIPNCRREEDRVRYENNNDTPFYGTDGSEPTIPCTCRMNPMLTPEGRAKYDAEVAARRK